MSDPQGRNETDRNEAEFHPSRRHFVLMSAAVLLAGCRSGGRQASGLPAPSWDSGPASPVATSSVGTPAPLPPPPPTFVTPRPIPAPAGFTGPPLISRTSWASGDPVPRLMNAMLPIRRITVHHDGMDPFAASDPRTVVRRLDAIRRAHRGRDWGDIGYHFAIDPAGRVWQARPLQYQGAHVKEHNEGNIGIVVLGNYDRQQIRPAQIEGLRAQVAGLMRYYRVGYGNIYTHMELRPTRCPGSSLKQHMDHARASRRFV